MSKIIKLTPQYIEECKKEFEETLISSKIADGKISFNKTIGTVDRKATVYFTEMAWMKMQALIRDFDKEIAWHGVASRGEDIEKDEYYITDILVYPQEVSGASVEMDVDKYDEWLRDNYEDERFNSIRMQGHSHVNMSVSPSGVDLTHQEAILDQLTDKMFYIFMIWNKSKANNIKIYDMAKNVLFEDKDVRYEVLNDGYGIDEFVKDAKSMVKEHGYTYNNRSTYGGNTFGYGWYPNSSAPAKAEKKDDKKEEPKDNNAGNNKSSGKRKGKRKKNKSKAFNNTCDDSQVSLFHNDSYDMYDDAFYYEDIDKKWRDAQ